MSKHTLTPMQVLHNGPVIPVLVLSHADQAVPLAHALLEGGIKVLEITLRTPCALEAIARIASEVPEAIVGAGTITNQQQFEDAKSAGARFIISPGLTPSLLQHASASDIPFIPGISSVSELMLGQEAGLTEFKFFPAEINGGTKALKAIGGPFPEVRFCPTGGVSPANAQEYLNLPNVVCVGGSWLAPQQLLDEGNYAEITHLAKATANLTR